MNRLGLMTVGTLISTCVCFAAPIDFATDVQPILANHCFQCHGPDEESREANLRLDASESASAVIEVGDPDASELVARVTESDPDLIMPPPESGKPLSAEQIKVLKQWIEQGATYQTHWAFSTPRKPDIPDTPIAEWEINPIDAFVAERLKAEQLLPSPQADWTTLVRRLSLDLTGLPPTPQFVETWRDRLATGDRQAYDDLVSELLGSKHFGERWARRWLDAARYADSDGYEKDKPREAWFYRDWVIKAFNDNLPYDQFIIRQIAGDLLPDATQDDLVATGFLRNSMVNEEGGADPEQFRMEGMFDRMDAIGKAILGLTIQCSQCHSHKYDPLQHEEYYELFAFINNTNDAITSVYTPEEQRQRDALLTTIESLENEIRSRIPDWRTRLRTWAEQVQKRVQPEWRVPELTFLDRTLGGQKFLPQPDGSYLCQGYAPTSFVPQMTGKVDGQKITGMRIEMLNDPNLPRQGPGRSVDGTWGLSEVYLSYSLSGDPKKNETIKLSRAVADRSPEPTKLKARYDNRKKDERSIGGIELTIDGKELTAWTNDVDSPLSNLPNVAWFEFDTPVEIPEGQHAELTIRLAQRHGGWNSDDNQTFNVGRFRIAFTADPIPDDPPLPVRIREILERPEHSWQANDWDELFAHWRTTLESETAINQQIDSAYKRHPHGTTQLTLSERKNNRITSLLSRGDFLSPVREVEPGVPDFLHELPESDEPSRLRFARWLVSKQSPTTARSIVNRIWDAYFGVGLVETSDDLGTQSSPPSHPELLDWLAAELMDQDWDLKHVHRLIVTSATYRQSSVVTKELAQRDPLNRLLARGARFRVPAETVRDIALSVSGLLNPKIGGRSVYPPAPEFLFQPPASYGPKVWNTEEDAERYRRALYTFRFRSVPYPMLENFDAVPGNVSCVRRSRSNTPLQALTTLNEPLFVECAVAMAANLVEALPGDQSDSLDRRRIETAFQRCVQREPDPSETALLLDYVRSQRKRLGEGALSAEAITSQRPVVTLPEADVQELAAWTLLCRVVLNLDETITRE